MRLANLNGRRSSGLQPAVQQTRTSAARTLFLVAGLVTVAWVLARSERDGLRLSVQFIGYTNVSGEVRVGILEVSNASPFAVVRGRGPAVVYDSSIASTSYAPTGWNVLGPGECERVTTEPVTSGMRWKFVVNAERLGEDSYGVGREGLFRIWIRQAALGLQAAGIAVPTTGPPCARQFSSNWIEP